jgi:RHS repeat-associated protein
MLTIVCFDAGGGLKSVLLSGGVYVLNVPIRVSAVRFFARLSQRTDYSACSRWLFFLGMLILACIVGPAAALASPPTSAIRYFYDADGQLKALYSPASETALYSWDPAGNLLSVGLKSSKKLSITQFNPARGAVGETVTISGTGFSTTTSSDTVKFNGTAATVSAATEWALTVKVPTGATSGTVSVQTTLEGPVTSAQSFTVASSLAPHVTSLSTTLASVGSEVTISGSNFETHAASDVVVVNRSRPELTSESATAIKFKIPGATTGGRVSVETPQGSATGPDLYIPPNGIPTTKVGATARFSVGTPMTMKLTTGEKVGLAIFDGTAGQRVSLVMSESSIGYGYASIWGPEGTKVPGAEASFGAAHGGSGVGIVEPATLPATGTYTVLVEPEAALTGNVKLSAYTVVDLTGSISPTAEGASKIVTLSSPGQNARYSVTAVAGEIVSLKTSSTAFTGWYRLEWVNPEGTVMTTEAFPEAGNAFVAQVKFPTTGTYTIVVNPEGIVTGSTTLTAYNASDVTGTISPSTEGESKTVTIGVPGQKARITFSGTIGQTITLKARESTIANGYVSIWSPEGSQVGSTANFSGEGASIEVTLPATGTYTILLEPSGADTGSVKLTAYLGSHPGLVRRLSLGSSTSELARPDAGGVGGLSAVVAPVMPITSNALAIPTRRAGRAGKYAASSAPRLPEAEVERQPTEGVSIAPGVRAFRPTGPSAWRPSLADRRGSRWETGEPGSPWTEVAPLQAFYGATALTGQALAPNGLPLAGVRMFIEGTSVTAQTDNAGRFLLSGKVPAGHQVLVVEGDSVPGHERYGTYEVAVDLAAHKTTMLDYTIWLTPLDRVGDHRISSPAKRETRLTTPRIPGLEVRLPAGTVITDDAGKTVHELNITAIPVDRPPFPLPAFVSVPLYFTVQPGRAYLSKGAQIIYPNWGHLPPGQRVDFWNYDPDGRGWYVYGHGTVTPNDKQVMPDANVHVWEFTGAMISSSPPPPGTGATPGAGSSGGDPVDLYTGLFNYHKTDLVLPDTIPIKIERTYRQEDSNSYSFGVGTTSIYDMRLWSSNNYHEADLVLPDGGRVHYVRTSSGEGFREAVYESTDTPGRYYASTLKWNESELGWDLTLMDGTTYVLGEFAPLQAIRDRYGNKLTITRESGQKGNITQITSPHGRWVTFAYDSSNRIIEIKDDGGRTLKYTYKSGLLEKVTDAAARTTSYEYNSSSELTAVTDGRGKTYVKTEYDANGRVSQQTEGDGGTYSFAYALNGSKQVEATTVTDPRKSERKVKFNAEGFPTGDTAALGTSIQQTTSYEPQAGTGLPLSTTDPLGRKTTYKYDSSGNMTQKTLLAGSSSPQTTEYKYEPGTNELASVIDPLKHTTTYHYGEHGERLNETDSLGHKTSFEYNGEGERTSITNPLGKVTKLTYEFGDLTAVTDPLSRSTKQFVDSLGRVGSTTLSGGQRTLYEYNPDNETSKVVDPLGAATSYEYDGDGDLSSTTDPNKHKSSATYDALTRLESETDPLEHATKGVYDQDGNLIELTDRRGKLAKFTYDALNRLTEAKYGVSGETAESTIAYSYDSGNRLTKVVDSATGTYTPEYDELNRLKSLATPNGTISYGYDEANRRTSMTAPGQEPVKYTYDEANRLKELTRGTQKVSFVYDEANRLTKTTLVDGVEEQYGYDAANELTSIVYKKGSTALGELDYSYDTNGRREAVWGSDARTGLPEAFSAATYNADNEQIERNSKKLSYDADGNLTSDGASEYKWNARNQLAEITGGSTASFAYDPFGRRITKTLAGATTKVLYDGANAVQETKGSSTANLLTGLLADHTLARTTSSGTESLLTDALGSTVALAGSTAKVETTYTYDPFGGSTHEGTASENPFQYAGRENDGNGLYYNRARYENPAAARFISQDPLGQATSGPNLYQYVANSPTNAIDPSGTSLQPIRPGLEPGGGDAGAGGGGSGGGGSSGSSAPAPGGSDGGFGPHPGGCAGAAGIGGKGGGLSEDARCKNYERLEMAEEENRIEEDEENETEGERIDTHIQQACDLSGPAVLVGLRKVPLVSKVIGAFCIGFTAGNMAR